VLLALGFLAAWWLRGLADACEMRALNVQNQQLNTDINSIRIQLAVRHERLQLAQEREETLTQAVEQESPLQPPPRPIVTSEPTSGSRKCSAWTM
jgi:hypothetical protein